MQGVQTMSSALWATRSARRTAVGEVNGRNDTLNLKMQNEERTWLQKIHKRREDVKEKINRTGVEKANLKTMRNDEENKGNMGSKERRKDETQRES